MGPCSAIWLFLYQRRIGWVGEVGAHSPHKKLFYGCWYKIFRGPPPPNKQLRHFKYPCAEAVKSCTFYRHFMVNIFLVPKMMKPFLMGWRGLFYGNTFSTRFAHLFNKPKLAPYLIGGGVVSRPVLLRIIMCNKRNLKLIFFFINMV